jgi:hypothetical protein
VRENDGLWPAAGLFVKEVDAVDQDGGHIVIPNPRSQANAPDFGAMDGERVREPYSLQNFPFQNNFVSS